MDRLCFLVLLIIIYYVSYRYFEIDMKYNMYFGIFVIIYFVIWYLTNYEIEFVYKLLNNIKETHNTPLSLLNAYQSNNNMYNKSDGIKEILLMNQGSRCSRCMNFILQKDLPHTYIHQKGDIYDGKIQNMQLVCKSCNSFIVR